jgi:hypothetical protein
LLAGAKAPSYTAPDFRFCSGTLPVPNCRSLVALFALAALTAGCAKNGDFDETGGIRMTRSVCPAVAVPANTGDITLFDPPGSRDARAIDVVANLTNLRSTCDETANGAEVTVNATFTVNARRSNAQGARDVVIPYFGTVVQGGRVVVSKSISRVNLHFNDGELRASTTGAASASVNRAAATLPEDVRAKITRKRKAGDADASIDPMADPDVRAAVLRVSFELLVGFQLTADQLQYNATR